MKIDDFVLENWLNPACDSEKNKIYLGGSCVSPLTVEELFELTGESMEKFMENLKKMIFRGLWILVWCAVGFGLGATAGIFVVFAVIFIFIVWIMLKMFGVSLLEGGGGSRPSRRSNDDSNDGRVELNDGTTIEKDSKGTWRNTNSWSDTYTQHGGNTFTQDN